MELYGVDVVRGDSGCAARCPECSNKCAMLARMVAIARRQVESLGTGGDVVSVQHATTARDGAAELDRVERLWRGAMPWVRAARDAPPLALAG